MPADEKPEPWYKDYFATMRRAYAEPDGEFVPFAVLRICLENRAPLPRWAASGLLEIGERLLHKPTRRGHNASPYDRDVQRSIDYFRFVVVEKFRVTEKLTYVQAIERAYDYFEQNMPNGGLATNKGAMIRNARRTGELAGTGWIIRNAGESSAIRDSYWKVKRLQDKGIFFPKLRKDYP